MKASNNNPAKSRRGALPEGRSYTVRLTNETAAKVDGIAGTRLWSFSKTLAVLIEKAIDAKVLK